MKSPRHVMHGLERPLSHFLIFYTCPKTDREIVRAVEETDMINAIIAARIEERELTTANCPDCVLAAVRLVS